MPSPICLGFAPMTSRCLGGRADLCRVGGEGGNFLGFWFSEMPGRTSTGWLFLENNKIWRGPKKSSFFGLGKNCALWNQSCIVQNWWTWCKTNRVHMVFFWPIRSGCHIRYFVQSRISYLPNSMILVIHIWISVWIIWVGSGDPIYPGVNYFWPCPFLGT